MEFIGNERMLIQDNHFVGFQAVPFITGWSEYYLLRNNHFEYTFGYIVSLSSYFFAENNQVEAVNSELNAETHGIFGRDNAYMEGNYVKNVGAKDNSYNDGEPLCVEVPNGYWNWGSVSKGTAESITVVPNSTLTWPSMDYGDLSVLIVGGRGQGQLRKVKLPDGNYPVGQAFSSYQIEVTVPFDVAPDHTSKFTLIAPNENATFYDNEVVDNAKGIWLFGNSFDGVIANNTSVDSEGIFVWSDGSSNAIVPDYYTRIVNNDLTGVSRRSGFGGIGFNTARSGGRNYFFATDVYSTEILNNKVTGGSNPNAVGNTEAPALNGIYAWAAAKASAYDNIDGTRDAVNTIIVGNKVDNLDKGVQISHSNYGAIIQSNTYSDTVLTFLNDTHTITDQSVSGVNSIITNNTLALTILGIDPRTVETPAGIAPILPESVTVNYIDGTFKLEKLTWDTITAEQYAVKGSFTVKGTLEISRQEVLITVNVIDPIITCVNTISVTTREKVAPLLPVTVPVGYSDGTVENLNVKWDKVNKKQYQKEGRFIVYGAVDGTTIKAAANVKVTNKKPDNKDINSINPINVMTIAGILPKLPSTVIAEYGDGTSKYVKVDWDRINGSEYSKSGSFVVYGKVTGTNIKAVANITVTEPIIVFVRPIFVTVKVGSALRLPLEVKAEYSNRSTKSVKVDWDNIDPSKLAKPGIIYANGTINGTKIKAKAVVIVVQDRKSN